MSEPSRNVKYMIIECEICDSRPGVEHDCIVAFLTDPKRDAPPVRMDADQAAAVELMVKGGLIPSLNVVSVRTELQRSGANAVAPIRRVS